MSRAGTWLAKMKNGEPPNLSHSSVCFYEADRIKQSCCIWDAGSDNALLNALGSGTACAFHSITHPDGRPMLNSRSHTCIYISHRTILFMYQHDSVNSLVKGEVDS